MQKRRDQPRDPDPSDRRGDQCGSERQTPAEWESTGISETLRVRRFRPPVHVLIDLRPRTRWLGAPADAPTAAPLVKLNCDRERRWRDSNPRTRQTRVSGFQDRGLRPEIPLVERNAISGGKPGGKKRRSSLRDLLLRTLHQERVEEVTRPFELTKEGVGVSVAGRRLVGLDFDASVDDWMGRLHPNAGGREPPWFRGAGAGFA